nr:MAG TPA: hypothetical protein [Caudoviricetes sp.]
MPFGSGFSFSSSPDNNIIYRRLCGFLWPVSSTLQRCLNRYII